MTSTFLNYINGEWIESVTKETKPSINPAAKNEIVGYVQHSTIEDLNRAVKAAKESGTAWKRKSGSERAAFLFKTADIMEANLDDLAATMTKEMGKTFAEAKGETARGIAILRYYAGEGMRKVGDVIPSTDKDALMFTTRSPIGVVGVITPWNFPVAIPIWKIAPALIYGNTVVFKPAQETAVTAAKVIACFHEAAFPKGTVNMVTGSGSVIGQGITDHQDISGITFTGSEAIGKQIGEGALKRGAKYQLEMGGKNPVIVLEDANIDLAVEATISGGLRSTGQKCTATSRVIVQSAIYDQFKTKLIAKIKEIKVGNGLDESTWMGPCASASQLNTVISYIEAGINEGATLLYGGMRLKEKEYETGFFVSPAVFEDVDSQMTIAKEEIFGPVLVLLKVNSIEEAIATANDSRYGLSASIFTENINNVLAFIDEIEAGLVRVNAESAGVELQAPFGGMKHSSSHSREQGQAAIEFYTAIKTVFVKGS